MAPPLVREPAKARSNVASRAAAGSGFWFGPFAFVAVWPGPRLQQQMFSELKNYIHRQLKLALARSKVICAVVESMIKPKFGTE